MNIENNHTNKDYIGYTTGDIYDIGNKGQSFVESIMKKRGYVLFRRNFRKIGLELDLIMFKYIENKDMLIVRIIEVKTRTCNYGCDIDIDEFKMCNKWRKVRKYIVDIIRTLKQEKGFTYIKHNIHYDLAIVMHRSSLKSLVLYKYIQNIDLLL